jgi:hypothetical protein
MDPDDATVGAGLGVVQLRSTLADTTVWVRLGDADRDRRRARKVVPALAGRIETWSGVMVACDGDVEPATEYRSASWRSLLAVPYVLVVELLSSSTKTTLPSESVLPQTGVFAALAADGAIHTASTHENRTQTSRRRVMGRPQWLASAT